MLLAIVGAAMGSKGRSALGRAGEDLAARWLAERGWQVLDRNVRSRAGEIDIVARRGAVVAFVEVKTRRSGAFGTPAEAVTYRKRVRIRGAALRWLAEHRPGAGAVRFDVLEVVPEGGEMRVTHVEDAF